MKNTNSVTINITTIPGYTARLVRDVTAAGYKGRAGLYEMNPPLGQTHFTAKNLGDAPRFVVVSAVEEGIYGAPDITVFTGTDKTDNGMAPAFMVGNEPVPSVLAVLVGSQDPRSVLALMGYALEDAEDDSTGSEEPGSHDCGNVDIGGEGGF